MHMRATLLKTVEQLNGGTPVRVPDDFVTYMVNDSSEEMFFWRRHGDAHATVYHQDAEFAPMQVVNGHILGGFLLNEVESLWLAAAWKASCLSTTEPDAGTWADAARADAEGWVASLRTPALSQATFQLLVAFRMGRQFALDFYPNGYDDVNGGRVDFHANAVAVAATARQHFDTRPCTRCGHPVVQVTGKWQHVVDGLPGSRGCRAASFDRDGQWDAALPTSWYAAAD